MNFAEGNVTWELLYAELTKDQAGVGVYALLDGAQVYDSDFFRVHSHQRHRMISLLSDDAETDAALAGPILIELGQNEHFGFADALISLLRDQNAVSFMSSLIDCSKLKRHLTSLANVVHDDGTEWVMRYFDPRILPYWMVALKVEQKQHVLSPICRWFYMNPDGGAAQINGGADGLLQANQVWCLTSEQVEYLMSQSLPYLVLSGIDEDDPMLFQEMSYTQKVRAVATLVQEGRANGLHTIMDLKMFCIVLYGARPSVMDEPEIKQAILDGRRGRFHEHVLTWGEEIWQRLKY